jgi:hypothetical protein
MGITPIYLMLQTGMILLNFKRNGESLAMIFNKIFIGDFKIGKLKPISLGRLLQI